MAVSVPRSKAHETWSTATCPPNRIVRSRVSSAGAAAAIAPPTPVGRGSALVEDRDLHVLDLELADELGHGPGERRVDLDAEMVHRLQRLVVLLAEHHFALRRL